MNSRVDRVGHALRPERAEVEAVARVLRHVHTRRCGERGVDVDDDELVDVAEVNDRFVE